MANQFTEPRCTREMADKIVTLLEQDKEALAIFRLLRKGVNLSGINYQRKKKGQGR